MTTTSRARRFQAERLLVLALALSACAEGAGAPDLAHKALTVETFAVDGGWGYAVQAGARAIVRQPHIPAVAGSVPFASEAAARQTGALVRDRLVAGERPTVTLADLDRLGALPPDTLRPPTP